MKEKMNHRGTETQRESQRGNAARLRRVTMPFLCGSLYLCASVVFFPS